MTDPDHFEVHVIDEPRTVTCIRLLRRGGTQVGNLELLGQDRNLMVGRLAVFPGNDDDRDHTLEAVTERLITEAVRIADKRAATLAIAGSWPWPAAELLRASGFSEAGPVWLHTRPEYT